MIASLEKKVKFGTLGCKLNQYESQAIREQFLNAGYLETKKNSEADVFVLNTCTVTAASDRESRYLIRKFHRDNPEAKIVVTGCYVERNREEIETIDGVTLTVLNREKSELLELLESCTSLSFDRVVPPKKRFAPLSISRFEGRTRAYVKVQDGCNHACSFCKVVFARGPSRSRPLQDVLDEVKRLVDQGYLEVVLSGIQLGAYGYDFEKRQMLVDLLNALSRFRGLKRIRLSSIEPTDVTDDLIEAVRGIDKVCNHLHIPLQSGSSEILARMNRRYRSAFYLTLIEKIKSQVPNFVLTTDVMIGFPGETDVHFEETVHILERTEPFKLHIFPFSPREGTRAATLDERVSPEVVARRREALQLMEGKLRRKIQNRYLGRVLDVLVEEEAREEDWAHGRSENYMVVQFPVREERIRGLKQVKIERIKDDALVGAIL